MRFEKIWAEQCGATKRIKRTFGAKSALDYLIGEKLITFSPARPRDPSRTHWAASRSSTQVLVSPAPDSSGRRAPRHASLDHRRGRAKRSAGLS